jgi:hypothetical protein
LHVSGGFGKFQLIVLVALLLPEIPAAFVAFSPVFVGMNDSVMKGIQNFRIIKRMTEFREINQQLELQIG